MGAFDNVYTSDKYYGWKGCYAMCAGGQTEPGRAIHICLHLLTFAYKENRFDTGVERHCFAAGMLYYMEFSQLITANKENDISKYSISIT